MAWIGLVLHIALGVFPFAASGLVLAGIPYIAVFVLWIAGLAVVITLLRRRSAYTPLVPVGCLLIWLGVVAAFGAA